MMISQDSTSDYKDSGIEGPEVEAELDSLPSSGVGLWLWWDQIKAQEYDGDDNIMVIVILFQVIPPDFPSTGSDMQPSGDEASGCTCGDEGQVQWWPPWRW